MSKTDQEQAKDQARAQVEFIVDMMEALEKIRETGEPVMLDGYEYDEEDIRERIDLNALSVEVRGAWRVPGAESAPDKFCVLLCTGGPAVRLIGDLSEHCEPKRVRVQYQDWGTPWIEWLDGTSEQLAHVLAYCQRHYFGE